MVGLLRTCGLRLTQEVVIIGSDTVATIIRGMVVRSIEKQHRGGRLIARSYVQFLLVSLRTLLRSCSRSRILISKHNALPLRCSKVHV